MQISRVEEALYATYCLHFESNEQQWIGTGFMFKIITDEGNHSDLLLTCKHNVEEADRVKLKIRRRIGPDPLRRPVFANVEIDLNTCALINSPCRDVCAIFLHPHLRPWERKDGAWPFIFSFGFDHLPDPIDLDAYEEFIMIGCPEGVYDEINNHPIIRRGVTASHPGFPYKGKPQFLIDCASHNGSSGSPIVGHSSLFFDRKAGRYQLALEPRTKLLGMLTDGLDVPDNDASRSAHHIHLGVALSSVAIKEVADAAKDYLNGHS